MLFNISKITVKSRTGKFVLLLSAQYTIHNVYMLPLGNQFRFRLLIFSLEFNTRINLDILLFVLNVLCFLT